MPYPKIDVGMLFKLSTAPAVPIYEVKSDTGAQVKRYRKELIRCGHFYKMSDGLEFEVTPSMLQHWAATFSRWAGNGNKVSIPNMHENAGNPEGNCGWVVGMYADGDSLYGVIDLIGNDTETLAAASDVSIYAPPSVTDGLNQEYTWPITHVALCTDPVIPGLKGFEAIAASLNFKANNTEKKTMDFTKIASELSITEPMTEENAEGLILSAFAGFKQAATEADAAKTAAEQKATDLQLSLQPKKADEKLVKLAVQNRELQLSGLVAKGKITPAVKEKLKAQYAKPEALSLSLGRGDEDGFDNLIAILGENETVKLNEQTGPQTTLTLSTGTTEEKSPLVKNAEKRASAVKS